MKKSRIGTGFLFGLMIFLVSMVLLSCFSDPVTKYSVTFDSQNGDAIFYREILKGEKVPAPSQPTKSGFEFEGWFKTKLYEEEWDFSSDRVNSNQVLYAKWGTIGQG